MFVTDTHPLVWYATNKLPELSRRVRELFEKAAKGESLIHVPSVVLVETAMLVQDGTIKLPERFDHWANNLASKAGFIILDVSIQIIHSASGFGFNKDIFYKLIVATAIDQQLPLITKDIAITESNLVEVYW